MIGQSPYWVSYVKFKVLIWFGGLLPVCVDHIANVTADAERVETVVIESSFA